MKIGVNLDMGKNKTVILREIFYATFNMAVILGFICICSLICFFSFFLCPGTAGEEALIKVFEYIFLGTAACFTVCVFVNRVFDCKISDEVYVKKDSDYLLAMKELEGLFPGLSGA